LAEGRYYVGLGPVFNPAYIHKVESGVEAARADLFKDGMLVIVAPPRTPSEAIQLAADLAKLLEAGPFFADLVEADSLLAATHTVPQLLAVALLEATVNRPGWREARKVAGSPYAAITSLAQHWEQDAGVQSAALLNAEHVGRTLDQVIAALEDLRTAITQGDEATLATRLERARLARLAWWSQRQAGNWAEEENRSSMKPPTAGEVFGRFIGLGGRKPKPKE
jgi:prephenate dehydrogenase